MEVFHQSLPYNCHANAQQFTSEKCHSDNKTDNFIVDDLLVFPTDDVVLEGGAFVADTSTDSSACNSSSLCGGGEPRAGDDGCRSFVDNQFSNFCTPYDDLAEFEWLSNFVEESLSNEDVQRLDLLSGVKARPERPPEMYPFQPRTVNRANNSLFTHDMTIPGKARTKRSRAMSCNWASRGPVTEPDSNMSSNSKQDIVSNSTEKKKTMKTPSKKEIYDNNMPSKNEEGRKCLHCASTKTPQWRTGPLGPRTLCNACGVRYKSGRLVAEYRPAASPTFVLTKHSNSHRKVLELRRQKMQKTLHDQHQIMNHRAVMLQMPIVDNYFINHP